MKITSLTLVVSALLLPTALNAAALVTYNFNSNGNASNATMAVTGSAVTNGGGLTNINTSFNVGTDYATNVMQVNPPNGATILDDAVTQNSFFTLTLTPASGTFSLDNISLLATRGGTTGPRGFTVRSSITGTTNLFQEDTITEVRPNLGSHLIDLSGNTAFDNISGPVTFNFYIHTPASGNSLEFDDIVFNGATIPEPSTVLLSVLGGLALLRRKR